MRTTAAEHIVAPLRPALVWSVLLRATVLVALFGATNVVKSQSDQDSLWNIWTDEAKPDTLRLKALGAFAWQGYLFSRPDSAYYYGQVMYDFAARKGLKKWMGWALRGQGVSFKVRGQNAKALDHWLRSMELSQAANDLAGVAGSLNNIAILYYEQADHAKALDYNERSLEMRERAGDLKGAAASLNQIGKIHETLGDLDLASSYYARGLEINERQGFKHGLAFSLVNIGHLLEIRGDTRTAMDHYERSLQIHRSVNNQVDAAACLSTIGRLQIKMSTADRALASCSEALHLATAVKDLDQQKNACDCLYQAHKELGHRDMALQYIERAWALGDSIEHEEIAKHLQQMEFVKELRLDSIAQAEKEQRIIAENLSSVAREKSRKNLYLFASGAVLVLAIGLWSRLRYMRRAKEEAERLRQRAEHSERVKHQFLANMSHEIRTPMNAIMGMTGILRRNEHLPDQDRYLDAIAQSSDNLLVILNDILDMSKIEAGKIDLERTPFDPMKVIGNVRNTLHFKAEEKGLVLNLEMAPGIPTMLLGDPTRLQQVLLNLAGNAVKFTERGSVKIQASARSTTPGSTILVVDVTDTGIGIPADKQSKIFEEFDQAYSDTSRKYGGSGLGLTISKRLVELQGGSISVKSEMDKGSTFTILIPYGIAETSAAKEQVRWPTELKDLRILLAEDNAFNAIVAQDELQDAFPGASIDVAKNGKEAVDLAMAHTYDLILMDVQMPEMNGYDATKAIKAFGGDKARVPIIAMTANVMEAELKLCKEAGMTGHIPKPFTREQLMQGVGKALR